MATDKELIRHIAQGDEQALRRLIDAYGDGVARLAMRIMCDPYDVEEVTQETFIRVWRHAGRFDAEFAAATWIFRIAANLCYDRLRRRRLRHVLLPMRREENWPLASSADQPLVDQELWTHYHRAVEALPPKQHLVFSLRELEGKSNQEVSQLLGWSADQVKANYYQAKRQIQKVLRRYGIQ